MRLSSENSQRWALFFAALLARLLVCCWAWNRVPPTADGAFYHVVAQRIARGLGYTWLWPDGAVTYAAHYPVGYPAIMAPLYAAFGPEPGVVMVLNAFLGAAAVAVGYSLSVETVRSLGFETRARSAGLIVGGWLVISPTLLGYTPALMTEGLVATFVLFSAWFALWSRRTRGGMAVLPLLGLVLCLTTAVYSRPQAILFAPVLGFMAVSGRLGRRLFLGAIVSVSTLALVLPWTSRNCDKMERCVFVSANGGWNLLIGTFPEGNGAWVALDGQRVPLQCREVFSEAGKDECFAYAAKGIIAERPFEWLSLVPAKWRATFDHTAAAAEHLAAAHALGEEGKRTLTYLEFAWQRLLFLFVLFGAGTLARAHLLEGSDEPSVWKKRALLAFVALGALGFAGLGAAWGWATTIVLGLFSWRRLTEVGPGLAVSAVVLTAVVHAVFFGAGRYSIPLLLWTAPLAALGLAGVMQVIIPRGKAGATSESFDTPARSER